MKHQNPQDGDVGLTCDQALAGVAGGQGVDAVRRVGDLVAAVLDGDGVAARHVGDVGHRVGPVPVVPYVGLLGLPFWVLGGRATTEFPIGVVYLFVCI